MTWAKPYFPGMRIVKLKFIPSQDEYYKTYHYPYTLRKFHPIEWEALMALAIGRTSVELGQIFNLKPLAIAQRLRRIPGFRLNEDTRTWGRFYLTPEMRKP